MPYGSLSDALILAALKRAERHSGRVTPGAGYVEVVDHLGLPMHSGTGRRLRPRFRELEAASLIVGAKRNGIIRYAMTSGRSRVTIKRTWRRTCGASGGETLRAGGVSAGS
jgi:hypothetical protein